MRADVVVVGAGWAGLSAAVHLAREGAVVKVIEAAAMPGGRARSFRDRQSGETLDSGQHLMLACYNATCDLAVVLGTRHLLRPAYDPVPLYSVGGGRAMVLSSRLPGPLHMLPTIASLGHLSLVDRLALGRVGLALALSGEPSTHDRESAHGWLTGPAGQSEVSMRLFWDPLVTALLNEEPRRASASMLLAVLRAGMLSGHEPSRPLVPTTGLGAVVADPAAAYVESRGGELVTQCRAHGLSLSGRIARSVEAGGRRHEADAFVLAVPSWRLASIAVDGGWPPAISSAARSLEPSPIVTVHLRYRRPIMDVPMAGLIGGRFHWLFDRSAIDPGPPRGQWSYSAVASAARSVAGMGSDGIAAAAAGEIESRIPGARASLVVGARVMRHPRATFSPATGVGSLRPGARVPGIENVFLAGDWTDTGLPATLEGAVRSGERSASLCRRLLEGHGGVRDSTEKCRNAHRAAIRH